jgi:hypothetical protein
METCVKILQLWAKFCTLWACDFSFVGGGGFHNTSMKDEGNEEIMKQEFLGLGLCLLKSSSDLFPRYFFQLCKRMTG